MQRWKGTDSKHVTLQCHPVYSDLEYADAYTPTIDDNLTHIKAVMSYVDEKRKNNVISYYLALIAMASHKQLQVVYKEYAHDVHILLEEEDK